MNIILVVDNAAVPTTSDNVLRTRLQTTLGHTVTLASDHDPAPNLSTTQVVVVAPSSNNNQIATKYDNAPCGVFAMNNKSHSFFTLSPYVPNGGAQYDFDVTAPGDLLLGGLTGNISLLTSTPSQSYTYFEDEAFGSDVVQVLKRGATRVALARARQGAIVSSTVRLPTRRIFFTANEGWPELFTAAAWTIFDNAVAYVGATPGQFPVAAAGADQEVEVGDLVQLNGSGSNDPDGSIANYTWRVISNTGPAITLSNTQIANPTFVAPGMACRMVLGLIVTDNHGDALRSYEDTLRVDVVSHLMVRIAQGGVWVEKPLSTARAGSWY
jgi:hypothetical protein